MTMNKGHRSVLNKKWVASDSFENSIFLYEQLREVATRLTFDYEALLTHRW